MGEETTVSKNFIEQEIDKDLAEGDEAQKEPEETAPFFQSLRPRRCSA